MPAQVVAGNFLKSFQEFPPSQKSGLTDVSEFLKALQSGAVGGAFSRIGLRHPTPASFGG